ncbi:MAG: hypothetical protein EHM58_00095 [Ignavibacteriae bacterium]|nr:MAG: hypothetical protein EHM58_00095 [Ignavibacteriota bacterium]
MKKNEKPVTKKPVTDKKSKIKLKEQFNESGSKFDEAKLQNEEKLYESASNFKEKNLQQYYTPVDFASFLARCLPVNLSPQSRTGSLIIDPMCGSGNLLLPFSVNPANVCIGFEIDKNNIPETSPVNMKFYNADFVKISKYLKDINVQFPVLVLNPPFSLKWTDEEIESQMWTMNYAMTNLFGMGCGYMICLKSFADKMCDSGKFEDIKEKIIYRLNVKNLFKKSNALAEVSVLFFSRQNITPDITVVDLDNDNLDMSEMNRIASSIKFLLSDSCYILHDKDSLDKMSYLVEGCYAEYKKDGNRNKFDIIFKHGELHLSLTNYKWHKIETDFEDKLHSVKEIHQKIPNYLALNGRVKNDVMVLINDGVLTISPDALERIERACEKSDLVITPFKALPPQQRLGYLTDHTKIKCIKSFKTQSVESGEFVKVEFEAGRLYSIDTNTEVNQVDYEKTITVKDNSKYADESAYKEEVRNFFKEVKALRIAVYTEAGIPLILHESTDDIKFLIEHFDIPNPQDVAMKFPRLHKQLDARLRSDEFSKYTLKEYQIYDLARAGLKDSLILSWDQGGGKSRGALAWK